MTSGELDERVTLQRRVEIADNYGNVRDAFVDLVTVWAKVRVETGTDSFQGARVIERPRGSVRLRKGGTAAGVRASDQVIMRGGVYKIISVIEMPRSYGLIELLVEKNT